MLSYYLNTAVKLKMLVIHVHRLFKDLGSVRDFFEILLYFYPASRH